MRARGGADLPIASYALIGDGLTAALVADDGAIDWLCHGRFDGGAVLCRLLDAERGGYLQLAPPPPFRAARRYVGDTNVLQTEIEHDTGTIRMTDCMPLGRGRESMLLRKLEGLAGETTVELDFVPTFDFAREKAIVEAVPGGCLARSTNGSLRLLCPAPMTIRDTGASSSFRVPAGQTRWVCLTQGDGGLDDPSAEAALRHTVRAWQRWSDGGNYPSTYGTLLRRSALVLKLLIHDPTGAMIAAPTTSLPERLGGERNWDYRFTWLRDASWAVRALMDLGHHGESMAFIDWLQGLRLESRRPAVLYDVDGRAPTAEQHLEHLRGYRCSRPVRVGNAAAGQEQHDLYGEVIAAIHMCSTEMPSMRPLRPELWRMVVDLANYAAKHWDEPDHGLWEVRDRKRHFVMSKVLCWSALDRALEIADRDGLPGPVATWRTIRARIRRAVLDRGFDEQQQSFVRAFGEPDLDASVLLLPRHGFIDPRDPRFRSTVERVRSRLGDGSGLLRRYEGEDGVSEPEGYFVACAFWLADALARQGRLDEAKRTFEVAASCTNDVGLLSEEIALDRRELLGNFPQAFSHLALVRAAMTIAECESSPAHPTPR